MINKKEPEILPIEEEKTKHLSIIDIPKHLLEIYLAETKRKTDKNVYENTYCEITDCIIKWLEVFQKDKYDLFIDDSNNIMVEPIESTNRHIVLSSHMDKVHTNGQIDKLYYDEKTGYLFAKNASKVQTSLGADDKNGIFTMLDIYRRLPADKIPSLVFSVDEEIGCLGSKALTKDFFVDKQYCIVIDRRNGNDLIYKGGSCTYGIQLPYMFKATNPDFKYEIGSCSDANTFSDYVDCINISCGYYSPHSSMEYTNIDELLHTVDAVEKFLIAPVPPTKKDVQDYLKVIKSGGYTSNKYSTNKTKEYNTYTNWWDSYNDEYSNNTSSYDKPLKENKTYKETCPVCGEKNCYNSKTKICWYCGDVTMYDKDYYITDNKKGGG